MPSSRLSDDQIYPSPSSLHQRGFTPLHDACNKGYAEIVSYLLVHGADCSLPDKYDLLPSDIARHSGNMRCIAVFLKYMVRTFPLSSLFP
jgi:hypothetical protein